MALKFRQRLGPQNIRNTRLEVLTFWQREEVANHKFWHSKYPIQMSHSHHPWLTQVNIYCWVGEQEDTNIMASIQILNIHIFSTCLYPKYPYLLYLFNSFYISIDMTLVEKRNSLQVKKMKKHNVWRLQKWILPGPCGPAPRRHPSVGSTRAWEDAP